MKLEESGVEESAGEVSGEVFNSVEQAPAFAAGAVAQESAMGAGALERQPEPVMRQVDCPMAFFMPQLVTDANGNAEVDFTVPQFNGTAAVPDNGLYGRNEGWCSSDECRCFETCHGTDECPAIRAYRRQCVGCRNAI